ncbi:MAG: response regulator, partial [Blastocatellia bacterium]|nr:response regulator [Blastocatellia bacterium]
CSLAPVCANREMCMHLVAASGAAIDKEYPRIPLSLFNASLIARGGTARFGDEQGAGEKLFGLQHGAPNGGRDSYALYPLRSVSGTVGLIGVFNHRPITHEELYTISQLAPAAVAAIRVAELLTRTNALRHRLEKEMISTEEAAHPEREGELEEAVAELTSQVAQLQVERDLLAREKEEAERRAEQSEADRRDLHETADLLTAAEQKGDNAYFERIALLETKRRKLEEENSLLKGQLATLAQNVDDLSQMRGGAMSASTERDGEAEKLRGDLAADRADLASLRETLPKLERQIASLEKTNFELREHNDAISETVSDLERSLRIAEDARARLEQDRIALEQKVVEMSEELKNLHTETDQASGENEELTVETDRLRGENQKLFAETERLRKKAAEMQASPPHLAESDDRFDALEKEFHEYRAQVQERIAELEEENSTLLETNLQLEEAAVQFESLTARLEESAIKLRDRARAGDVARAEVEHRKRLLEEENRRLGLENQARARFLADISHEFRTPMNAIIGFTSGLIEDRALKLSDRHRRNLERISYNARNLLELINNVLDLSKIEAGRMDVYSEPADARDLIERSLGVVEPLKDGRPIRLVMETADDLPPMHTDRMKVQQILINLLSNAIKFTPEGEVKVIAERAGASGVRIAVSDTGIGIAESDIPKIFEEFHQAGSFRRGEKSGTGLGLAITRRLVELLGGEITVVSRPEKGSVFSVTLPLEIEDQVTEIVDFDIRPADPDRTALVIDSDPASLYLTKKYLSEENYSVAVAEDAGHGIEIARLARPSVVTVDVDSFEDGISIIRQISLGEKASKIIAISNDAETERRAMEAGADLFLRKPIKRVEMSETLRQMLPRARGTVLVVEDDPDALDVVVDMIEGSGYEAVKATNGREALDRVEEAQPDAIILDLMLPEMDGFEVQHRLSLNEDWSRIPVILLTARDLSREERRALDAGTARIIQKGNFSRDELLAEIRKAIATNSVAARADEPEEEEDAED